MEVGKQGKRRRGSIASGNSGSLFSIHITSSWAPFFARFPSYIPLRPSETFIERVCEEGGDIKREGA
jgi:hypothetical protein